MPPISTRELRRWSGFSRSLCGNCHPLEKSGKASHAPCWSLMPSRRDSPIGKNLVARIRCRMLGCPCLHGRAQCSRRILSPVSSPVVPTPSTGPPNNNLPEEADERTCAIGNTAVFAWPVTPEIVMRSRPVMGISNHNWTSIMHLVN